MSDDEEYISIPRAKWAELSDLFSRRVGVQIRSAELLIKALHTLRDDEESDKQRGRIEVLIERQEELLGNLNNTQFRSLADTLDIDWNSEPPEEPQ
jgi:hypothetical protein